MCFRCRLKEHVIESSPNKDTSDNFFHWNTENPKDSVNKLRKLYKTTKNSKDEKQATQDICVYDTYVFQCRKPLKKFCRQLETSQLDFICR